MEPRQSALSGGVGKSARLEGACGRKQRKGKDPERQQRNSVEALVRRVGAMKWDVECLSTGTPAMQFRSQTRTQRAPKMLEPECRTLSVGSAWGLMLPGFRFRMIFATLHRLAPVAPVARHLPSRGR